MSARHPAAALTTQPARPDLASIQGPVADRLDRVVDEIRRIVVTDFALIEQVNDYLLLTLELQHGINGGRVSIEDYIRSSGWRTVALTTLWVTALVFMVIGASRLACSSAHCASVAATLKPPQATRYPAVNNAVGV